MYSFKVMVDKLAIKRARLRVLCGFASLMAVSVLKFHKSVKPMKKCGLFALKNNRFAVILWH